MTDLRTCTNLLSVGGEWWPSVKRGKETFGRAMDALMKKLGRSESSSWEQGKIRTTNGRLLRNVPPSSEDEATSYAGVLEGFDTALPTSFDDPPQNNDPYNHGTASWTLLDTLGDSSLQFDAYDLDNAGFGTTSESMDSAVESFIAEFLQNDTTWNPF